MNFLNFISESKNLMIDLNFMNEQWVDESCEYRSLLELEESQLQERMLFKKSFTQPWISQIDKDMSPTEIYNIAAKAGKEGKAEFDRVLKNSVSGKNPKVLTDVKTHDSFIDKGYLRKRGWNIDDVLRGAILVETEEDIKVVTKKLYRNTEVLEHDIKEPPTGDLSNEYGYYGSHHFAVRMPKSGIVCEVQVMTKRLWAYKHEGHKIYVKTRTPGLVSKDDMSKELARSREIFKQGNTASKYLARK